MGILDTFRFGRKKARPVGQRLEKGLDATRFQQRDLILKIGIFFILVLLTVAAFPRDDVFEYSVNVGDTWNKETLVADFDFSIRKATATYEAELEQVKRETPPFFESDAEASVRMTAHRDTVVAQLGRIFRAYEGFKFNQLRGRIEQARLDSIRYYVLRRNARLKLTPDQWSILADSYAERVPGLSTTTRVAPQGPRLDETLVRLSWEMGGQLLTFGVLDIPLDSVFTDVIRVRDDRSETELEKTEVYGLNEAYLAAREEFARQFRDDSRQAMVAEAFFRAMFQPSLIYLRERTAREWQEEQRKISPTEGLVESGTILVRKGDIVTSGTKQILTSLEEARDQRWGKRIRWRVLLGQFLVTFVIYLFFFLYLYLLRRAVFDDNTMVVLMAVLFAATVGLFAFALRVPYLQMYVVPVSILAVLLTVMFDSRVGLFGTITISMIGAVLLQYDFEFFFATVFAGTMGVHSVRDIKNRAQFFLSAGVVFLSYTVVLGATYLLQGTATTFLLADLVQVAISSFFLVMAYPLLWVFERSFGLSTDLTFLELSDTNRPLLKDLSLKAPGTFNHSLQVANLAEAAAAAVGANALITRVGALYHDIGKMQKPEYFVENQRPGENPHDQLKPRMSALIIASHVKEGIEMARSAGLPQQVISFIPTHHGTSLISYFYQRAIERKAGSESDVQESEFRYPGPKPVSKETGILMLADSVEAASRSLTNPTHKRLESLIESLFKSRVEDGQLENTDLTFLDLNVIKETFLSILLGMYHVRVKYPGQDRLEEAADDEDAKAPKSKDASHVVTSEPELADAPNLEATKPDLFRQTAEGLSVPKAPSGADDDHKTG
jgi:putative nucleotidyltransferase with HDIG domain